MSDVYLAYASSDRERARPIAHALMRAGFSVWWDAEARSHGAWRPVLAQAEAEAVVILALWSPAAAGDRRLRALIARADARHALVGAIVKKTKAELPADIATSDLSAWTGAGDDPEWIALIRGIMSVGNARGVSSAGPAEASLSVALTEQRRRAQLLAVPIALALSAAAVAFALGALQGAVRDNPNGDLAVWLPPWLSSPSPQPAPGEGASPSDLRPRFGVAPLPPEDRPSLTPDFTALDACAQALAARCPRPSNEPPAGFAADARLTTVEREFLRRLKIDPAAETAADRCVRQRDALAARRPSFGMVGRGGFSAACDTLEWRTAVETKAPTAPLPAEGPEAGLDQCIATLAQLCPAPPRAGFAIDGRISREEDDLLSAAGAGLPGIDRLVSCRAAALAFSRTSPERRAQSGFGAACRALAAG